MDHWVTLDDDQHVYISDGGKVLATRGAISSAEGQVGLIGIAIIAQNSQSSAFRAYRIGFRRFNDLPASAALEHNEPRSLERVARMPLLNFQMVLCHATRRNLKTSVHHRFSFSVNRGFPIKPPSPADPIPARVKDQPRAVSTGLARLDREPGQYVAR